MGWLTRLRGEAPPEADVVVVSRAACHLCVEMEHVVRDVLAERPARRVRPGRLRVLDLDVLAREDPALLERWTTKVPVLLVDDREVAHWRVDAAALRTALRR